MAAHLPAAPTEPIAEKWEPGTTSSLYSLLPDVVRRRVDRFPSIRQTASTYATSQFPSHRRTWSTGTRTPPPSYHEQENLRPSTPRYAPWEDSRPSSAAGPDEPTAGIQWDYARQGIATMAQAVQDLTSLTGNWHLGQQLYVDGLKYCLQSLPADLTPIQRTSLRAALPEAVLCADQTHSSSQVETASQPVLLGRLAARPAEPALPYRESTLHFLAARGTAIACLIVGFVLPWLQAVLVASYRFERRHQLSDRALARGYRMTATLSRMALRLISHVVSMNEVKMRRLETVVMALLVYCMREVGDGVDVGLREGMHRAAVAEAWR